MSSPDFRLLPEAEFQRLTPQKRAEYMAQLQADLEEKLAKRARRAKTFDKALKASLRKNPRT